MFFLFANNAISTLAADLLIDGDQMQVAAGTGALFPAPSLGFSAFRATLFDEDGELEIVQVTFRNADVMTVQRAMEGTVARAWPTGTPIRQQLTKGQTENFLQIPYYRTRQVTTEDDLTIQDSDVVLLVNRAAASEFELPLPSALGRMLIFKDFAGNSESYPITLDAGLGRVINGQRTLTMAAAYATTWLIGMSDSKWGTLI